MLDFARSLRIEYGEGAKQQRHPFFFFFYSISPFETLNNYFQRKRRKKAISDSYNNQFRCHYDLLDHSVGVTLGEHSTLTHRGESYIFGKTNSYEEAGSTNSPKSQSRPRQLGYSHSTLWSAIVYAVTLDGVSSLLLLG